MNSLLTRLPKSHLPKGYLRFAKPRFAPTATSRRPAAFTLIELLVVISIIAILAGLGFAAMQGALASSKKAQARNDVNQIASAIKAYQLEYGRLPKQDEAIAAIAGENSKGIVFLEAKIAKEDKGGLNASKTKFFDPWGAEYTITLDDDYDNRVQANDGKEHLVSVIVETTPPGDNSKPINNVQ